LLWWTDEDVMMRRLRRSGDGRDQRRGCVMALLGGGVVALVVVMLVVPNIAALVLRFAGGRAVADVAVLLDATPMFVQVNPIQPPSRDTLRYGERAVWDVTSLYGPDQNGVPTSLVAIPQTEIMPTLCAQVPRACDGSDPTATLVDVTLYEGGAVVTGDFTLNNLQQRVGLVVRVTVEGVTSSAPQPQVRVVGVQINGTAYDLQNSPYAQEWAALEQQANTVLAGLFLQTNTGIGGAQALPLRGVSVTADQVVLVFR
jgi:hypothetical protein